MSLVVPVLALDDHCFVGDAGSIRSVGNAASGFTELLANASFEGGFTPSTVDNGGFACFENASAGCFQVLTGEVIEDRARGLRHDGNSGCEGGKGAL